MEDPTRLFWGARVGTAAAPLPIPTIESRLKERLSHSARPKRLPRPTCPEVRRVDILNKDLAFKMQEFLRRIIDPPLAAAGDVLNLPTEAITKMLLSEPRPRYVPKPPPKMVKTGPGVFDWD